MRPFRRRVTAVVLAGAMALLSSTGALAIVSQTWTTQADFDAGTYAMAVGVPDEVRLATTGVGTPDPSIAWWDSAWGQRRCIDLSNGGGALTEFQVVLSVDTGASVAGGRMDAAGDDLRFVSADGSTLLDYWIESGMNTAATTIWVQVDSIPVGSSTICMYYDNPAALPASDPLAPFTYAAPEPLYVAVSDRHAGATVHVVSYIDGNTVTDGTTTLALDAGDVGIFPGATHTATTVFSSTGPISIRSIGNGTEAYVPMAFAGTSFVMPANRGTQTYSVYAPYADATVSFYNGATLVTTTVVAAGTSVTTTANAGGGNTGILESDEPILVMHRAGANDLHAGYPATTDPLYGVRSRIMRLGFLADGTSVTADYSAGASATLTGDRGDLITQNDGGGLDGGPAAEAVRLTVTAGGAIGAVQQADRDGNESTTFLPALESNIEYYVPTVAQYASFACSVQGTANLDAAGTTLDCSSANGVGFPGKTQSGGLLAGARIASLDGSTFWMYYEHAANSDETNVWGAKQARKDALVDPTLVIGPEESPYEPAGTWTSAVFDTGGYPFYGELSWNPSSQVAGTSTEFQIATAPAAAGPFNFVGPDGTAATFYTAPGGTAVDPSADGNQFAQVRAFLATTDVVLTPVLEDATLTFELAGEISGTVFEDQTPSNGVFDLGEPGIDGVTVSLYRDDGDGLFDDAVDSLEASATTAGGAYSFGTLLPGVFFVQVDESTLPSGYVTPGTTANPNGPITVTDSLAVAGVDFGYEPTGTVIGQVFSDLDADGTLGGEPGLDGVTVNLWLDDGDGLFDAALDTLVSSSPSAAGGLATFEDLAPDTYFVEADTATVPATHDPAPTTANPIGPILLAGNATEQADLGFQPYGSLTGSVFIDLGPAPNGVLDVGEPPLAGASVDLWLDDGDGAFDAALDTLVGGATTAADGSYSFTSLLGATYFVDVSSVPPPALTPTVALPSGPVPVTPGGDVTGVDLGFTASVTISGTVFEDTDGNGALEAGETGLGSVAVDLFRDDGDGVFDPLADAVETSITTAADGTYTFGHPLAGGTFFVRVDESTVPAGVLLPGTSSNPAGPIAVSSLESAIADFGYQFESTIEVTVFRDDNSSAAQDAGEPDLAGVTVTLHRDDGDGVFDANIDVVVGSATTASPAVFSGLDPGSYWAVVDEATLPTDVSPPATTDNPPGPITVGSGGLATASVGYVGTFTVTGVVYLDADEDGLQDPEDSGLAGVTVTVWLDDGNDVLDAADTPVSVITGADGTFTVVSPPGTVFIEVDTATLPEEASTIAVGPNPIGPVEAVSAGALEVAFGFLPAESVLPETGPDAFDIFALAVALTALGGLLVLARKRSNQGRLGGTGDQGS